MAQVPQYGSSPKAQDQATPVVPQHASVTGTMLALPAAQLSNAGQALNQTGDQMAKVALDWQTRDNADMVFRAETALRDSYMEYEKQATQRLGRDAVGLREDTQKWWDDSLQKHAEGLQNDAQRRLFQHQVTPLRQSSLSSMTRHEVVQRHKSIEDSANASSMAAISAAAANPYDPLVAQNTRATLLRNNGTVAQLNGQSEDVAKGELAKQLTLMHMGVIAAQVDKNPSMARAYFDANKGEIDGTEHAKIEKMLEIGGIRERTQAYAQDIISRAGGSESKAIELAQSELKGMEEDETVQRINAHYSQIRAARSQGQREASDAAWAAYDKGGMDAIPAPVLASMDPEEVVRMREYARAHADESYVTRSDQGEYVRLREMAVQQPDQFLKQDRNSWRYNMDDKDRQKLNSMYDQVLVAKGKPPHSVVSAVKLADMAVSQVGLVGQQNSANAAYVKAQILNDIAEAQASLADPSKPLTYEQMTAVVDNTLLAMSERNDEHLTAIPKAESLTVQNRIIGEYAGQIPGKQGEVTPKRNKFKAVADEVLSELRRRRGGELDDTAIRGAMDMLLRKGQIDGSGFFSDDKGYYFEFLDRPDHINFVPDDK